MDYKIDFHKLMYHPQRVVDWLDGKPIVPLYLEVSPIGMCNHHCIFCGVDFARNSQALKLQETKRFLGAAAKAGVKSVMFGGEGEPLIHPQITNMIKHAKDAGLDVALTTNGVYFTGEMAEEILPDLSWIKFSVDAGTSKTYARVHGTHENDFHRVMANIANAVSIRNSHGGSVIIGMQAVALEGNVHELELFIKKAKALGADYAVIKSYSQHPSSRNKHKPAKVSHSYFEYQTDDFQVIARDMEERPRIYDKCYALPFWSYVSANGDVWACSTYIGDMKFFYGNIYEDTVEEIWCDNELAFVDENCRLHCRMDKCNEYLWRLKNPDFHDNFI
jgi:GTP 3',8-cyclase